MIRRAVFAGRFYAGRPGALREEVESHLDRGASPEDVLGCVCPHAGYVYSGDVAGAVLSAVIAFSHRGMGRRYAVWPEGDWQTPLGDVPLNRELTDRLIGTSKLLEADTTAFTSEHSGEVMLPFLQVLRPDVDVVMMSVYPASPLRDLQTIGYEMADAVKEVASRPLILASSDMTHYAPAAVAERQDRLAIDRMLELDETGLFEVVRDRDISMCGVCPVVTAMTCVKALGATRARLVRYENSGKASGDHDSVVGYAGLVFKQAGT